jgi:Xaa-Pro dipeptidase
MERDRERVERAHREVASAAVDAVVVQLNAHVLLLSGYAPVLGQSLVVFPRQGEATLIVPEDEVELARQGWWSDVRTYQVASLNHYTSMLDAVEPLLTVVAQEKGLTESLIGFEGTSAMVPASYSQVGFPTGGLREALARAIPRAGFVDLSPVLRVLQATKTPDEIKRLRQANEIAALGMLAAREAIQPGVTEAVVAAAVEAAIQARGRREGVERVMPFAHVMSGDRSALAYRAYNLTSRRTIETGDPVLVQLEVYVDGFWSEVTRTFFAGNPGAEGRRIYAACLEAQRLAFGAITCGAAASAVDQAARSYLAGDGFGPSFKHGLGHGVGFQAISHLQPPRLYPGSTDTLLEGQVFNVEPSVYVHGWGGVRINDTVAVQPSGTEILTQIPRDFAWAMVHRTARAAF